MPDKPRDPLDEPDDLLADDEPTDSVAQPEPPPSVIEVPPEPPSFDWEAGEEPEASDIDLVPEDTDTVPMEPDEPEPEASDLYWVAVDEAEEEPGWQPIEEGSGTTDWPGEEEDEIEEEDWAALEVPESVLHSDRLLVGLEENASLPELGLDAVIARMETGLLCSVLLGEEAPPITTTLRIGAVELTVTLQRESGTVGLRLGQDVLAGRFIIDPARRMTL